MTGNKPLGNLWHKRNMTLTWDDLCSRVTAWTQNSFPAVCTPETYVRHGLLVPGLRHALSWVAQLKDPWENVLFQWHCSMVPMLQTYTFLLKCWSCDLLNQLYRHFTDHCCGVV